MAGISYHFSPVFSFNEKITYSFLALSLGVSGRGIKGRKESGRIVHLGYVVVNELNAWHFPKKIKYANESNG